VRTTVRNLKREADVLGLLKDSAKRAAAGSRKFSPVVLRISKQEPEALARQFSFIRFSKKCAFARNALSTKKCGRRFA
jgi:hypothetical protein